MEKAYWMELLEEAPVAVRSCLLYFQERYMGSWQTKMLDPEAVLTYLRSQEFEITVSTFGIPNREDWYFELTFREELLAHERDFSSYELAAEAAIIKAFLQLETTLQ